MALVKSSKYGYRVQKYVKKNGDITYYAVFKLHGKLVYKKVGTIKEGINEKKAFQIRSKMISQLKNGVSPAKTFDEIAEAYFLSIAYKKSALFYRQVYNKHLKPLLGKKSVDKISDITLDNIHRIKKQQKLSNGTIRHILALANRIASFGHKRGYVAKELFKDIKYPKVSNERVRYLTKKEIIILKKELKNNPILLMFVELALQTGARANAILNLQKKDIDMQDYSISIFDEKTQKYYRAFVSFETFQKIKNICKGKSPRYYIVSQGYKPLSYQKLYSVLQPILNKLFNKNIKDSKDRVVIHTFRHTFASHLAIKGVPIQQIQKLLHHSSIKTTARYAKLLPDSGREHIEELYN